MVAAENVQRRYRPLGRILMVLFFIGWATLTLVGWWPLVFEDRRVLIEKGSYAITIKPIAQYNLWIGMNKDDLAVTVSRPPDRRFAPGILDGDQRPTLILPGGIDHMKVEIWSWRLFDGSWAAVGFANGGDTVSFISHTRLNMWSVGYN